MSRFRVQETLRDYLRFQKQNERFFQSFQSRYSLFMRCRAGCSECCTLTSVFAIEAYFIALASLKLGEEYRTGVRSGDEQFCPFLHQQRCLIYGVRPLICRTHGLVLLYQEENGYEWDSCGLNFGDGLPEAFREEDFYQIDHATQQLVIFNLAFSRYYRLPEDRLRVRMDDLLHLPGVFLAELGVGSDL